MRAGSFALLAILVAACSRASGEPLDVPLVAAGPGGVPAVACRPALIGEGGPPRWRVAREGAAIEEVSAEALDARYPLCFLDGLVARDVEASIDITPRTGELDRAGGIILRAKDDQNFYLLRANALEHNVRLYHVVGGVRRQFAGVERNVFSDKAQTLKLRVEGEHFTAWFDGKEIFRARDRTFTGAGYVGLWTKADSVTGFSAMKIDILAR